jgi:pathogenesis-related protein 1
MKYLWLIMGLATLFIYGCEKDDVLTEDAQKALDFHNKVRNDVSSPPLEWDFDLAKYAQEWADYLAVNNNGKMEHRGNVGKNSKNAGENIFMGAGKEFSFLDASEAWYSEINDYTYTTVTEQNYLKTGHYTQMVWKDTKKVGMGISKSSNGATIIVANYLPPGNYIGQKPY